MQTLHPCDTAAPRPPHQVDPPEPVPRELQVARHRAVEHLRHARLALAHGRPRRAIKALRDAWHELEDVPGGDAFQDLVAIDEAARRLARQEGKSATSALDAAVLRLRGLAASH